jgi:hypothetical protein
MILHWPQLSHMDTSNTIFKGTNWYSSYTTQATVYSQLELSAQRIVIYSVSSSDPYYQVCHLVLLGLK